FNIKSMKREDTFTPLSGYMMLVIFLFLIFVGIIAMAGDLSIIGTLFLFAAVLVTPGFFTVSPNSSVVMVLFGDYKGTVKSNGFHWALPFFSKKTVSLRARNFDSEKIKVNDKVGNPIQIGAILVWQVKDTFKAAFEVDNYENFVRIQSDS